MHRSPAFRLGSIAAAAAAGILVVAGALAQSAPVVTDLGAPRGLTATDSGILVADQGNGRILRMQTDGTIETVAEGLPSVVADSPEGPLVVGVTAAIEVDGAYFATVGEAPDDGFQAVYSISSSGAATLLADLGAYEEANNTDDDVDETGAPEVVSNPYDLVTDGADGVYVSDSGANAILHVSATGEITPYAIFPVRENPLFGTIGGPTMDQVPTGMEIGPDGAIYVSTLTGFPFPSGAARVYRVEDLNADGDALDDGEVTTYAEGLTAATNLAFEADDSLLVTEFSTSFLENAPGRLVRVSGGTISVVAEPLISPTGVAVAGDGTIIVAQEFLGIVAEATAATEFARPPISGDLPASGFGLVTFGGTVEVLRTALTELGCEGPIFATSDGAFIGFIPNTAVAVVNADFLALWPDGVIPDNTPLLGGNCGG